MHSILEGLRLGIACAVFLHIVAPPAVAQIDTTSVPQPPAAELAVFEPFFGKWEHAGDYYMGVGPWQGTLEMRPAIKGWYVEGVIETRYGPIDRELRTLTTWDARLRRYRTWRFETLPQSPPGTVEAEGRIEGKEYITEWKDSRGPNGERGTFRNRMWMEGPDVLVIRSEAEPEGSALVTLGEWRFRRIRTAPDGGEDTTAVPVRR